MTNKNPCHKTELTKLNRIGGQVEGIKRMIDENRHCTDILTQLKAIRSAVRSVEATILETHLQHCVSDAMTNGDQGETQKKIDEIKDLFKRYDEV